MTKQAEALKLANDLLTDIELSRLSPEQCVLKASRLARLLGDDESQEWLRFELHGYDAASSRWGELMTKTGRWSDETKTKAYSGSVASLQHLLEAEREKLAAMHSTSLAGDFIVPAQNTRHVQLSAAAGFIATMGTIISGVMAALHDFVARTYYELLFSEIQADLFSSLQSEIDARVSPLTGHALSKIDVINERLKTGDAEAISHAMTTCRRLVHATADAVFPASEVKVEVDGQELAVTNSHVLNRLNAYAYQRHASKGRRDRIRRALSDLYGRVSKGVHEDVTPTEARYLFLQTYLTLGEIVMLDASDERALNVNAPATAPLPSS